jgi:diaminohydroxyphosphoribosylaminopyrimidine deaminase/5-amino-6-(5-phosphoribosylamino)uracil reductase
MTQASLDADRLREALALAETAIGNTEPNPRVGCVIGSDDGRVFGTGATQEAGGPHAEVMALRDARSQGHDLLGATAWVTLEPCAHHGRTPPCCDALIEAGLGRVVVALPDPFPQVAGAGMARIRAAGIRVDMADEAIALAAWYINVGFFSRVLRQRPWIRVKVAASLDGRTGLDNRVSQWITGEAARIDGHAWRRRASAVLTGVGTVLADDPRLDVRLVPSSWQPLRVVVDSTLRTPPTARLLAAPGRSLIATVARESARCLALERSGAEVLALPGAGGRVDLAALAAELSQRGVNELHVESGPGLTTAMLQFELADEILLYMAPRLLGGQRGMVDWEPLQRLQDSLDFEWVEVCPVGVDLRARLRPAGSCFGPSSCLGQMSDGFTSAFTPV